AHALGGPRQRLVAARYELHAPPAQVDQLRAVLVRDRPAGMLPDADADDLAPDDVRGSEAKHSVTKDGGLKHDGSRRDKRDGPKKSLGATDDVVRTADEALGLTSR